MKLYFIEIDRYTYDCNDSHVIAANNEQEVMEVAASACMDEGRDTWFKPFILVCIGKANEKFDKPEIVLTSFNAG